MLTPERLAEVWANVERFDAALSVVGRRHDMFSAGAFRRAAEALAKTEGN
jgi:hypothetical protein